MAHKLQLRDQSNAMKKYFQHFKDLYLLTYFTNLLRAKSGCNV